MDHARSLGGQGALFHRPGPDLVLAHGEKAHGVERTVAGRDEPVQCAFFNTQISHELGGLLLGKLGQFGLDVRPDHHRRLIPAQVRRLGIVFRVVGHSDHRFAGQQAEAP